MSAVLEVAAWVALGGWVHIVGVLAVGAFLAWVGRALRPGRRRR